MKDMQDACFRIVWGKWLNETWKTVCTPMFNINIKVKGVVCNCLEQHISKYTEIATASF